MQIKAKLGVITLSENGKLSVLTVTFGAIILITLFLIVYNNLPEEELPPEPTSFDNVICPTTFRELTSTFEELNMIIREKSWVKSRTHYVYEGREAIDGEEADRLIIYQKLSTYPGIITSEETFTVWFDSRLNVIKGEDEEQGELPVEHVSSSAHGSLNTILSLFKEVEPWLDNNSIANSAEEPEITIGHMENDEEAFADLGAPVYRVDIVRVEEGEIYDAIYRKVLYIADYGDYQVVVGLEIPSVVGLPAHYWLVEHFIFR